MPETRLSIVVPLHNEQATLPELWRRLQPVLEGGAGDWEVVFVDDGSADRSTDLVRELCRDDRRVRQLILSRNFGHQNALTAGIDHATGRAVVLMDADLQDRPEAIPDLVATWEQGFDVVYALRVKRKESLPKRIAFKLFYWLMDRLSGIHQPLDAGIFCLIDRKVLQVLRSMPEHNRYFPGLRAYAGFRQKGIEVERDARFAGGPRVGWLGLVKLALDGILSFSYVPIRLATFTGLVVAVAAFVVMCNVLYKKLISHEAILGWASTLTAILFLGAMHLIVLGLLGEYIGRIYEEVKKRPYYIVRERINFD